MLLLTPRREIVKLTDVQQQTKVTSYHFTVSTQGQIFTFFFEVIIELILLNKTVIL